MIKYVALFLLLLGTAGLILGVFGIFDSLVILQLNPWALAILGLIFFTSGIGLLKKQ